MTGPLIDVVPRKLLRVGVLAAPLVCLIGIFAMTAGTDESWIVLSSRGLAEHGRYGAESPFRSVYSTGGAYTVAATILHALGGGRLAVVRLLSALSLTGLLFLIRRFAQRSLPAESSASWIMGATLLAVPGTFMLAAQAYGEILATVLVVAGALGWGTAPAGSWGRRVWTGVLLGTAAATRVNCVVALAAIPIAAFLTPARRRAELVDAGLALVVGAAVFAIQYKLLIAISIDPAAESKGGGTYVLESGPGLNFGYLIPLTLNYWSIAQDFLPFFVIAAVVAGWAWARPQVTSPQGADLLLVFSLLIWAAWLARAPIPHLRYLWPGLAGFAIVGGLVLGVLDGRLAQSGSPAARAGLSWVAVSLLIVGYMDGARTYQQGESDVLSWQWHRSVPYATEFGPLRALRSQKSIVQRLNELPPGEIVATIGMDTALSLLTRRSIVPVGAYYSPERYEELQPLRHPPGAKPRWLAVTPFVNRFPSGRVPPALHRWIEQNCRLDSKFGPYVLYEVQGPYPESPDVFALEYWSSRLPLTVDPRSGR